MPIIGLLFLAKESGRKTPDDAETAVTQTKIRNKTKIIFYSASTTVGKMATGTMEDISVGTDVGVNGASNTDGSTTATMIQIRPAGSALRELRNAP